MPIRDATEADLVAVKAIYDREVETGTATFDTVAPPIDYWFLKLLSDAAGDHLLVAVEEEWLARLGHPADLQALVRADHLEWLARESELGGNPVIGLVEMLLFVLTVFVAYAYVWRRGGLEWD